ncbi:MAG: transglycosylase SLT domain-containing protein [Elusimicrobiota bacterium]|jgi:membrane-bound lytic murein transglycosylase C
MPIRTRPRVLSTACAFWLCLAASIGAQDGAQEDFDPRQRMQEELRQAEERMRADVAASRQQQAEDWGRLSAELEAQYRDFARKQAEQRQWLKRRVEQQWAQFQESSNKSWVDYNALGDAMSRVDFEKGEVEITTLVPVDKVTARKLGAGPIALEAKEKARLQALAEENIRGQAQTVLAKQDESQAPVLQDQILDREGRPVAEKDTDRFVKEQIAPAMQIAPAPVVAKDGKPRLQVTVKIPLAPDHLKIRAGRYSEPVTASAKRYALDPALIYAVIHTESYFNPLAKSQVGALGLMQIVPKTAGNEAYKFLYKQDKLILPEYLYDPDNNILLGATYLHMLQTRYYGKVKDPDNRRLLSIAAYNCGPGNVRKTVTSQRDVDTLASSELLALIRSSAPKETQAYVPRVQERMALYQGL